MYKASPHPSSPPLQSPQILHFQPLVKLVPLQTLKAFKLWLPKIASKGGKDIHIFFAGHGLASDNGEDLYILPQDGESSLLEDTAISRVELISLINKVNPKSVTMFFDTCYSG